MHHPAPTQPHSLRLLFSSLALVGFASCVGYPTGPGSSYPNSSYIAPTSVGYGYAYAGQDSLSNYQYYPRYGTYYNPQSRQYYYQQGNSWHTRATPYGVSSRTLRASPYVPLNLHSNPANHHTLVTRSYPTHWSPPTHSQGYAAGSNRHRAR